MIKALSLPFRGLSPRRTAMLAMGCTALLVLGALGAGRLMAQIEGDRGIAPVVNTGNIDIGDIQVNTTGKTALEARAAGWKQAYRLAWTKINGPALDDGTLAGLVTQVEIEHEQVGPHRYIATLGIEFDRQRAGGYIAGGTGGAAHRSGPVLVIPVLYSGGVSQVYEVRGPWQRAWAQFHTGASALDYVRPSGAAGDSLVLTSGQPSRRSRAWWRGLLDQYGASDVIVPVARLERQWPGGPVEGVFTARFGLDDTYLASFTMSAPDEGGVPAMLDSAVQRLDSLYTQALEAGKLGGDASVSVDHPTVDPRLAAIIAYGQRAEAEAAARAAAAETPAPGFSLAPGTTVEVPARPAPSVAASYTVQFASPDARAVDQALLSVRGTPGVGAATPVSLAIGGTSVMKVTYSGALPAVAAALRERGWQVAAGTAALRIHR